MTHEQAISRFNHRLADFCKPASIKSEPNPREYDIARVYYQLRDLTLSELSGIIPDWNLRHCEHSNCDCEWLVVRSADHPNAMMDSRG